MTIALGVSTVKPAQAETKSSVQSGMVKMTADEHLANKIIYDGEDTPDKDAIQITTKKVPTLKLKKSDLKLNLDTKLKKVSLSVGKVKNYDFGLSQLYKKKGKLLVPAKATDFKANDKGVVTVVMNITNLKPNTKYTFIDLAFPGNDLLWRSDTTNKKGELSDFDYPIVQIPFVVQETSKKGKINKKAVIYTAKGKKTKKFLSKNKEYSFTQKKRLNKKVFYKVEKTNNWVLASSISFKK